MNEFVSIHTSDDLPAVATLLLSRPPSNGLSRQLYREIVSAAADLGGRDDICAVILFGGHEIFSAGDDMHELSTLSAFQEEHMTYQTTTHLPRWPRLAHAGVPAGD